MSNTIKATDGNLRCKWCDTAAEFLHYHDTQWGFPVSDDHRLFEKICLESFQAGLSWQIVLNKRENFRKAFDNFNPDIVAKYDESKIAELIQDKSIIRNKMKIVACVNNAQRFLEIQKEFGSFDKYIWDFVDYKPIVNAFTSMKEMPAKFKYC